MPSIKFDTIVETSKVVSGFRDIQNAVHQTAERVEKDGKSIDDIISKMQNSMNIAIGGWSIGKFVNQMMQVRGQFQQTEMAFKTMLQSEEKADALMKQLIRTAAITPFGVEDVTEGAKQLIAFNVAAEDVNKTLIGLGDVAAGMGLNLQDMVMLYGTTIAKGKMDTMDLYQFLNRGIPIADEIAKVMGLDVTNAIKEVQKQIKAGKVTSDVFIQAMQNMSAEGSKFGGLMEAQSKTITGQISNIKDAIEQMFNELGKSQEGVINTGLGVVSTLVENWKTVGKVLMTVVAAYGAYKASVLAMIAISKAQIAWESAKAFISLARSITSAKDAMALFNLVSSSNPLGLVLGVIAAGVTLFGLFGDSAEDAATKTSKFTESANEASSKVESLVSILKTAKEGSKVYKDTIKELSSIYSNYGITIDRIKEDESNLVSVKQQEIDKSNELIEQIKLEATERNRANAISKVNEEYNNRVDSAQQALLDKLKDYGTSSSGIAVGIQNIVSDSVIKQFDELEQKMSGLNEHSKEYQTYLKQYNQLEASLISESENLANAFGFTGDKTRDAMEALIGYLYELRVAKKRHTEETDNINKAADATEDFGNRATSTKNRINALQKQLQSAGEDVHVLYNRVKEFMQNYSENNINFHVNFDAKIPSWMQNMNIPELGRLGKYFSALARDLANNKKSGALVNGKWMSTNDIAQRGWDYTNAANTKQTKAEDNAKRKQREKEEAEANAKKNATKVKKASSDAKKTAEDRKKAQEELNEDLKRLQQDNADSEISLMREGTEKKLAEIKNDYKKRSAEIDKQEAEFKKKNKEAGKKGTLTKEQTKALGEARHLANLDKVHKTAEISKEQLEQERNDLNEYLKEYGDIQQQKLAITQEYAQKIAKAENAYQKASLANQRDSELQKLDASDIFEQIDWENVFSDLTSHTKEYLVSLRNQLQELLKSGKLTDVSDISKVQEKVNDINSEISKQGGLFDFVGTKQQEQIRRINEAKDAQLALNEAKEKEADIAKQYEQALSQANDRAMDLGVSDLGGDTAGIQSNLDKYGIDKSTKEYQEMATLLTQLALLEGKLAKARRETAKATAEAKSKEDGAKVSTKDAIANWFSDAQELITKKGIDQLPDLFSKLGMDGMAGKATLGLSAFNDAAGAAADFVSGNYIGALSKGVSSLQNFTSALGIGGDNTAKMQDKIDELNQKNTVLAKCLEELNTTMQKTNSLVGVNDAYQQSKELIKAEEKNASAAMIAEAQKHGTWRSSLNSSVDDNKIWKQSMAQVSNILGKTVRSSKDFLSLSAEDMKKIRDTDKDLFIAILNEYRKEGGKGGRSDQLPSMIQDYIEKYAEAINDLNDQLSEKITQTSFEDLENNFFDTLMDMDKEAEDFTDDFSKYLMKAVLKAKVGDLLDKDLQTFYDKWAELAKDGLTQSEIDTLNKEYNDIVQKGLELRDEASKITGYTGSSSQSATSGGWSSMGQETADELNGRFTALQIAGETIAQDMETTIAMMETLVTIGMSTNGAVLEIRNMMIMTNSYLEDVVKYVKLTYTDFGSKLDDMNARLKNI
jgi:hypothetical protein